MSTYRVLVVQVDGKTKRSGIEGLARGEGILKCSLSLGFNISGKANSGELSKVNRIY